MSLRIMTECYADTMAKETGFAVEHCQVFLHPELKKLTRAVEECLVTKAQKAVMAELDITVEQVLREMYTPPEFVDIKPIFDAWNAQLKREVFKLYTPKYPQK
jgi:hypothetical protein